MFFEPHQYGQFCDFVYYHQFLINQGKLLSTNASLAFAAVFWAKLTDSPTSGNARDRKTDMGELWTTKHRAASYAIWNGPCTPLYLPRRYSCVHKRTSRLTLTALSWTDT